MILAFDTSNYTTSLALVTEAGDVLKDERILLTVKEGERGLRQSDALFQHGKNLPLLMKRVSEDLQAGSVTAVACSTRPRTVEGSYMPCFLAGEQLADSLSALLNVPVLRFSHQEGHMAAASYGTVLEGQQSFLAWHLSGGTCELLQWRWGEGGAPSCETLLAHTMDLSFGQVLDRVGVALGFSFPCGKELDQLACAYGDSHPELLQGRKNPAPHLSKIPFKGPDFNLSGLEAQLLQKQGAVPMEQLAFEAFYRIGEALAAASKKAAEETGLQQILFAGGVSSSRFIRRSLSSFLAAAGTAATPVFGNGVYSPDNAVGIGLLGARTQKGKEAI